MYLWISSEGHGAQMGCYGDDFATPLNIDASGRKPVSPADLIAALPTKAPGRGPFVAPTEPGRGNCPALPFSLW